MMKQYNWILRMWLLGIVAFSGSFVAFPQEDKTSLLQNADMEQGLKGWGFDGEQLMYKNTKVPATKTGFYGMNQGVLEAWNGKLSGLAEGYVMQRLSDLPDGTYVFGAYAAASKQNHRSVHRIEVAPGNTISKYEFWNNRDSIYGVKLFANEASVKVATNNPDWHGIPCMKNGVYNDGHAMKFNVAVTLKGSGNKKNDMQVGIRYANTNANYVAWDNATLYYFGDMSEADALDAMAKIDVEAAVAVADTLKKEHMNADTLEVLTKVLGEAEKAEVTAANLWDELNKVFFIAGQSRKSAADYTTLKKNLESAQDVADSEWRDEWKDLGFVDRLAQAITEAENAYNARTMNRAELLELRKELSWAVSDMKVDSLVVAQDALKSFISEAKAVENKAGGYVTAQIEALEKLDTEISEAYLEWKNDAFDSETGEIKAAKDRTVNPDNLFPYVARVYDAVEEVKNNPFDGVVVWSHLIPRSTTAVGGWYPVEGAIEIDGACEFTSEVFTYDKPVEKVRLTVNYSAYNSKYFSLSGMEFYDGDGNRIKLTADMVSSNADHNSVAGFNDGQSYPGLVDDSPFTYFQSDWSGKVTDPHYIEVVLPNGGYDAFCFKLISRINGIHQFPGEIVVTTPVLQKGLIALTQQLDAAKALNVYTLPEPGYLKADFSYVTDAIATAEALLENEDALDSECAAMATELENVISRYNSESESTKTDIIMPEEGKAYRLVSAFTNFYDRQSVEKAITINNNGSSTYDLWWEDVCADHLQQEFMFEPIMKDGKQYTEIELFGNSDGTVRQETYYCYYLKNVSTGLYVGTGSYPAYFSLFDEPTDTIRLKSLGRGQWNIIVKGNTFHVGAHNSGYPSENLDYYGGTWGVSSLIVSYNGGLDGASAWFIREMPSLPLKVEVSTAEFKSNFYHFDAANTITLTADKECTFADLALYDLYGTPIAIDSLAVSGNTATITQKKNLVGCTFSFTNKEGVEAVLFNTIALSLLREAYDAAVAIAPVEGNEIGMCADITEYTEALEAAKAMLASGGSGEEIERMIKRLKSSIENLTINMPEEGKYYFIYSAVERFEIMRSYKMAMYTQSSELLWGHENHLDLHRYWQFEPATEDELSNIGMDPTIRAFYIKNAGSGMYIADGTYAQVGLTSSKDSALPYVVTPLGGGCKIALDGAGLDFNRLHAAYYAGGASNGGKVGRSSDAGPASAWEIVETENNGSLLYGVTVAVEGKGNVNGDGVYTKGKKIVLNAVPSEGHRFVQWSNGSVANPYTFTLSQDIELEATFLPNTYRVEFVVDGVTIETDSIVYGEAITLPEEPAKYGYTFSGWQNVCQTMPGHDLTIEGEFFANEYKCLFMVDGVVLDTTYQKYGQPIALLEEPRKEGHTFSGWSETPETMPANDITITGSFTINKYFVTFKIGDEVVAADSLEYDAAIVAPEAPEKEGYTFDGWGEVAETVPANDVTYEGTYTANIYKVYYYVGEELVHTAEIAYGEAIPEYIYEPTGEGDVFKGWVGDTYETMPAHDVTYVANITNGIDAMSTVNSQQSTVIYDLTGRKVEKVVKGGVYIINGKRVLVK